MTSKIGDWGHLDRLLDVCGLIMQKPRTVFELHDITEYQARTIHRYIVAMSRCGLLRVIGHTKVGKGHAMRPIFAWAGAGSDTEPKSSRGSTIRMIKVLKLIGRGARTTSDIERITGFRVVAIRGYLKRLHRNGLIYVSSWARVRSGPAEVWDPSYSMQSVPYTCEDRPRQ